VLLLLLAGPAFAQTAPVAPPSPAPPEEPPGRFRLGPVYLTPSFRVRTIGLDTNVFYTPTDRRTDLTAAAGPGLEVVVPISGSSRLVTDGSLDYLYFLRTESERQLNGAGRARLDWKTTRSSAGVEEAYRRTYGRLGFEVDRRVFLEHESTGVDARRRLASRFSLGLDASRGRFVGDTDEPFLGADLRRALSRDVYLAGAALEYHLTVKTSLVLEGEYQSDRFLEDAARDADQPRVLGGLRTDESALVSGRALVGVRMFRLRGTTAGRRNVLAADLDATWNVSPRTRVGVGFQRDLSFSAFTPSDTPTLLTHAVQLRVEKELTARVDLKLFARRSRFTSDGAVEVELAEGETVRAVRDDTAEELGADLGYRFRRRLRVGMAAVFTERRSSIATFGIDGLLLGATVTFVP
jgi:hypothetical protein